jgi:hypothetical protein
MNPTVLKPMAARSEEWACGRRSLAGISGSNPAGGMDVSCEFLNFILYAPLS